jgi:ADP-heptose:LPS heptosyltransferase
VPELGEFDLEDLRALLGRASMYIGGDSGPLHIAATTRTPIVALFGPTLAERSMPWRDPRWPAAAVDAGPLPCRPCSAACLRAGRLPVSDANHGGRGRGGR